MRHRFSILGLRTQSSSATRRALLTCAMLILMFIVACAPKGMTDPQARALFSANQISLRIERLSKAVADAEATGGIERNDARTIITFALAAHKTLAATPAGWFQTVKTAWDQVKAAVPADRLKNPAVQTAWAVVDAFLVAYEADGGAGISELLTESTPVQQGAIPPQLIQALILNFAIPEFLAWLKRRRQASAVPPDANGNCPTGYDKGADGLCYLHIPTAEELAAELTINTDRAIEFEQDWLANHPPTE